ncbi:MAG TPA: cytochrome c biogenesis protein CcsA, partial [candidate division Zixibacteria bacterium]|nr:cytochrome c biogenesis protein CcsA [candidate division Zixibacteria bacterium]
RMHHHPRVLFFTGMMLKVSPFALLDFSAADGAGLNPLLQDPWMVVHPPVMFVGYALTGAPFALALAALVRRDFSEWVRRAAPWVVLTVLFLAAGNILGGYWAYKTLGWGGYWAWDPVENSSLIPWFVALALLHGLALERRTGALRRTNLLLAAFTFWLVVCGTFMTRSGVLSDFSVHSFVDLGQNEWLIVFLLLYAGVTLGVFLRGMRSTGYVPINFNFFGREFSLVGAMLLLFAFSLIVLFWSSLPILTKIFGAQPRAADIATYNAFALPIAVLYALLLILSPLSSHRPQAPAKWRIHLTAGGLVSLAVALMLFVLHEGSGVAFVVAGTLVATGLTVAFGQRDLRGSLIPAAALFVLALATALALGVRDGLYLLFFATAAAAVGSNAAAVARRLPGEWLKAGAHLTHFGFGLMLLGVLASSAFSTGERVTLPQGQPRPAYHLQVSYEGMQNDIKWPHNELILKVVDDGRVDEGRPELYFSERMNGYMKRPYIRRGLLYDLYFSPQDIKQQEGQDGLLIGKAEKASAGGYEFSFLGFDMGDHSGGGEMTVTALIAAARDGRVDTLRPAVTMATADDGSTALQDLPAAFGSGDSTFTMSITRIHA